MRRAGPVRARRVHALAYTFVTTAIVLLFALAEWGAERLMSERSRAASTAVEIGIVLVATLLFRPVHQRVEEAIETAFNRRKHHALAALAKFRHELTSFNDLGQLLRRVIEAVEHYMEARACAVYLDRDGFRAEASSYDVPAEELHYDDPVLVRLRSSGVPAPLSALKSSAPGTHAFPITAAGELIGFISVDAIQGEYDPEETHMLAGLGADLAGALVSLDPHLRPQKNRRANNLPADLPAVIGREHELAEIGAALAHARLVTITGSGGVGKTRVALDYAAGAIEKHENGAWFVDLAPITSGSLVASTMLAALGAASTENGVELDRLIDYLRPRDALVVLDNCEHLVSDVASIIARILAGCPHIAVIATSREILHLDGEHVYRLGSLAPNAAVELFAQRACAVLPAFDIEASRDVVGRICERLDGVPLAIELAAARIRSLSAGDILGRLDERFRLLTSGSHTATPRQQTLAATIEWSYDLLTPEEQSLFCRLAAFRGSFSLAAAAAVCAQGGTCDEFGVLDVLTSLNDKSLVTVTLALTTRYRLLETIRAFAAQKSIENQAAAIASDQHGAYFSALASQAYHEFDSRPPSGWIERLTPDIDNFRAALSWMLEGPGERSLGAQLAADCAPIFLRMELLSEGLHWSELAGEVPGVLPATGGRIDYVASMMQNNFGRHEAALLSAQSAVSQFRASSDARGLVRALSQVAQLLARARRFEQAAAPADEAVREARLLGEPTLLTTVLRRCGFSLPPADIERARGLFEEALQTARAGRDFEEVCRVLDWWASRESAAGFYERALELATQALEYAHGSLRMDLEVSITGYALAACRLDGIEPHARRAAALAQETPVPFVRALAIAYWAPFHAARGPLEAALLFGYAIEELRESEWEGEDDDRLALQAARRAIETAIETALKGTPIERALVDGAQLTENEALVMLTRTLATGDTADVPALAVGDSVGTLLR
ncbi:MAG TPA: GAF domain-containing protein [Candidatus Aquilonibacter sp.]